MKDPYTIIRTPLLTEKCHDLKEVHNQVAFKVDTRANKLEVKAAVEKIFKVQVERLGRNAGKRPDWKKAVVTLKAGENIEIIEGVS